MTEALDIDIEEVDRYRPTGPCRNCGKREAEIWWVGEGGALDWAHGMGQGWCNLCCCRERVKLLEKYVAMISEARAELRLECIAVMAGLLWLEIQRRENQA